MTLVDLCDYCDVYIIEMPVPPIGDPASLHRSTRERLHAIHTCSCASGKDWTTLHAVVLAANIKWSPVLPSWLHKRTMVLTVMRSPPWSLLNSRNPSGCLRLGPRLTRPLGPLAPGRLPARRRCRRHPHRLYPLPRRVPLPRRTGPRPAVPQRLLLPGRHPHSAPLPVRPIHSRARGGRSWRLQRVLGWPVAGGGAGLRGNSSAGAGGDWFGSGAGTRCRGCSGGAAAAASGWDGGAKDRKGAGAGSGHAPAAGEAEDHRQ